MRQSLSAKLQNVSTNSSYSGILEEKLNELGMILHAYVQVYHSKEDAVALSAAMQSLGMMDSFKHVCSRRQELSYSNKRPSECWVCYEVQHIYRLVVKYGQTHLEHFKPAQAKKYD